MNAVEKRNFTDLFIGRVFSPIQSFDNFIDSIVSNIDTIFIANCIKYLKHCKAIIEYRIRPMNKSVKFRFSTAFMTYFDYNICCLIS